MTMNPQPSLLDVFSGVIAIVAVVGTCMASRAIGFDFRAIYALTAAAFFLAGFARGRPGRPPGMASGTGQRWRFLGTAALVMNNGPHLLFLQIGLVLMTSRLLLQAFRPGDAGNQTAPPASGCLRSRLSLLG